MPGRRGRAGSLPCPPGNEDAVRVSVRVDEAQRHLCGVTSSLNAPTFTESECNATSLRASGHSGTAPGACRQCLHWTLLQSN